MKKKTVFKFSIQAASNKNQYTQALRESLIELLNIFQFKCFFPKTNKSIERKFLPNNFLLNLNLFAF